MAARLTSALFVSAIVRRVNLAGGFATVARKGAEEAGAIFICVPDREKGAMLYAQVPQSVLSERDDAPSGGRLFEAVGEGLSEEDLAARFATEARFDPDFWVLEIEISAGRIGDFIDLG